MIRFLARHFSLKSLPYKNISNTWCTSLSNTYFCHIFIYLFTLSIENAETSVDFYLHLVTFRIMILPTFSIPWKRRQSRYPSIQTNNINEIFHSENLKHDWKLNVKHVKIFRNSLCDDSWHEKYDDNAFGINDKYSYKTKIKFGKYASIYPTKTQLFSKPNK